MEDYQGAIADFNEAIRLQSDDPDAYIGRGKVRSKLVDYEGAIADFNEAIRLKPDYTYAYVYRGCTKCNLGDHEGAIVDCTEAIHLKQDCFEAYQNLGCVKLKSFDFQGAISDLNQAISLHLHNSQVYCYRGVAKYHLRNYKDAIADFDEAIRLDPDYAEAQELRALAIDSLKDRRNKWRLFFAILALLIACPQIYAYFRYRDFPLLSAPSLLITRLPSSFSLERTLTGIRHQHQYNSRIIFGSDGKTMASLGDDSIQIWNYHTGELLKEISVEQLKSSNSIEDEIVAVSPDFKHLISRHDQQLKVWDLSNLNQAIQTLVLGESIKAISPDLKYLITGQLNVWNSENLSKPLYSLDTGASNCLIISKDFNYVAGFNAFGMNGQIRKRCITSTAFGFINNIWDLKTSKPARIRNDYDIVNIINERYFIGQEENKTVIVDSQTGKVHLLVLPSGSDTSFSVNFVDIDQQHKVITTIESGRGRVIRFYHLDDGKLFRTMPMKDSPGIGCGYDFIKISSNGELITFNCRIINSERWKFNPGFNTVTTYSLKTGMEVESHNFRLSEEAQRVGELLDIFEGSGDSRAIGEETIAIRDSENNIKLINLNIGKINQTFVDCNIRSFAFSSDGQNLISESEGKIRVWKVQK